MKDFTLREDDQRLTLLQQRDRAPVGSNVMSLPVHAKAAVLTQHSPAEPVRGGKNLPGSHEMQRQLQLVRRREQGKRIGVRWVIGSDERPIFRGDGIPEEFNALHFDTSEPMFVQRARVTKWSPERCPE